MLEFSDLLWIILGVSAGIILFCCFCIGCILVVGSCLEDEEKKDDKTEETSTKTTKTVEFSSTEVGWAVPNQSGGLYPPSSSGPVYPPSSSAPYPPPYPTSNTSQPPYPVANSMTPSSQPYLPYPVQNVNEKRNVKDGKEEFMASAPLLK